MKRSISEGNKTYLSKRKRDTGAVSRSKDRNTILVALLIGKKKIFLFVEVRPSVLLIIDTSFV